MGGLFYLCGALIAARQFRRQVIPASTLPAPTISVLKPIKGVDPNLHAALQSHCTQQYAGRYELLLGMAQPDVAVEAEIERLRQEFPEMAVRVIPCPERLGASGKISTLAQMLPHALGEVIVVNDADIRVGPHYLARVADGLAMPGVGMVTAPYFGNAGAKPNLWARIEALGISVDLLPGVLLSRMMERGVHFGLGSTLALRRETLATIGGFEVLLDELSDDYMLGALVARSGRKVLLLHEVVQTSVPPYTFHGFWEHQLRWFRTIRDARRWGYVGVVTTYAIPWALLNIIAWGGALPAWTLLSLVLLARLMLVLSAGINILRDGQVLRDVALVPLRDVLSLVLWAWSFASDEVVWRGERFRLRRGVMTRID